MSKKCSGCGWSSEYVTLQPLDILYGHSASYGKYEDLYYHLQVCDDCFGFYNKTGEDPRYRYHRADRGIMKERIDALTRRIKELEAITLEPYDISRF